jgi:integrase
LAKHYVEHQTPRKRPSSQAADRTYLQKFILPAFGTRKVASVAHDDIAKLHRRIAKPILANRVLSLANTIFNTAIKLEWIDRNPCRGVERHQEHPRQRYLTSDEISRLMAALDRHPGQSANAVRLLLLTGSRRAEVLGATWDQFDLDAGVWTKPHSSTKQRRLHRVPLGESALAILRTMKAEADERIANAKTQGRIVRPDPRAFPGLKPGQPQHHVHKFWRMVCDEAGIEGCRLHDLRHSFASLLASGGSSLLVIGQMLGHSQPGTTARYSHLYDAPLREAANAVSDAVTLAKPVIVPLPCKPA